MEKRRLEKQSRLRQARLEEEIAAVNRAISVSESGFNEVIDSSLTEALIYDRAALEARRSYLLREARVMHSVTVTDGGGKYGGED